MGRHHPQVPGASPAHLAAFHEEMKRIPNKWRACPLVRIEPWGSKCREVRRCTVCSAELTRPVRSLVLQYADQVSAAVLPVGHTLLTVSIDTSLADIQREVIQHVYELVGSVQTAAQLLGVSRRTLYNWCPNLSDQEAELRPSMLTIPPQPRKTRQ